MIDTPKEGPPIVVSLTTIRSRLERLTAVIGSLQSQTRKPDVIQLNISEEPYLLDEGIPFEVLPHALRTMCTTGELIVRYVKNTGPYRKLLPALATRWDQDCVIVTADDDALYPRDWLRGLYESYLVHGCVTAYRTRAMVFTRGQLRPYGKWPFIKGQANVDYGDIRPEFHSLFTLPTGRGGILYHPRFFRYPELLPDLMALAPQQDDLAFKMATLISDVPTHTVLARKPTVDAGGATTSLFSTNNRANFDIVQKLFEFVVERGLFSWAPHVSNGDNTIAAEGE